MRSQSRSVKPNLTLAFTAAALSAALLWGCDNSSEMGGTDVSEKIGDAAEETREAANAAAEKTREAVEEAGDRIESATD